MLTHPQFDPVAFWVGPLPIRWYGLMYLLGFVCFIVLGRWRARQPWRGFTARDVEDLLFWGVFGVIVGGRLGTFFSIAPSTTCSTRWRSPCSGRAAWHRTAESSA